MMLKEREVVSLPGDAAAARWSEDDLCSQAGFEAQLGRVQARVCGPPRLSEPQLPHQQSRSHPDILIPTTDTRLWTDKPFFF